MWGCRFPFRIHRVVDTAIISSEYSPGSPVNTGDWECRQYWECRQRPNPHLFSLCNFKCTQKATSLFWKVSSVKGSVQRYQSQREAESSTTITPPTAFITLLFSLALTNNQYTTPSINLCCLLFASSLEHELPEGRNFHFVCLCFSGVQNDVLAHRYFIYLFIYFLDFFFLLR